METVEFGKHLRDWALHSVWFMMAFLSSTTVLADIDDLLELSLEEIMNIEVDTVTKTAVELAQAPSPVTVITHQDIKKSFATSIPELLRQVAGVNVRWNTMVQTIDIRGFGQNPFTNVNANLKPRLNAAA
jgi:outer membrane receptor for ferrienterochelin and colicin